MATLVRSTIGRGTLGSTGSQYGTMKSGTGTMKRNKAGDTATLQKKKNIKEQIGNKLIDMANAKYRIVGLTRSEARTPAKFSQYDLWFLLTCPLLRCWPFFCF